MWLILGISYGVLNILTYRLGQDNLIGTFLSSIPMWLVIPYFAVTSNDSRQKAIVDSMLSLTGIFAGYHITRVLKHGVSVLDSYDMLWIVIGAVFGIIWAVTVYPVYEKHFGMDVTLIQKNILPSAFIAEAINEMSTKFVFRFPQNFNACHLLLLIAGVVLFTIFNRKELNRLNNYIAFIIVSLVEYAGIKFIYKLLHAVL